MSDHNDRGLHDLLSDTVADVEPSYALDEIRARTKPAKPRWPYAAGASILAIAASITAFAVLGNDPAPSVVDPGTSTSGSSSPSPSPSDSASPSASATEVSSRTVAVYYAGSTPDGARLYREFRLVESGGLTPLESSVVTALTVHPEDDDYYNIWPGTGTELLSAEVVSDVIRIELDVSATRTHGLPESNRRVAIEQLIFTAQAAVQERLPVQFLFNSNPAAEILGLPASEPLANGPVLETLALVSLTTPSEGMVVDNDEPLVVEGAGNSFEGNIVTWVEDSAGAKVVDQQPVIAGWMEEKLFPYEVTLDLTGVAPGDYLVVSSTDDPSGEGRAHTDSRRITVVD